MAFGRGIFLGIVLSIVLATPSAAQVFRLQVGTSSLSQTEGATLQFWAQRFNGWFSAGDFSNPRFGGLVKTELGRYSVGLGDETVALNLPTDGLRGGNYFLGRGLSVAREQGPVKWLVFAGGAAEAYLTAFAQAAEVQEPVAAFFLELAPTANSQVFSHNIFTSRPTAIQSWAWTPSPSMRVGIATGVGGGDYYLAGSVTGDWERVSIQAALVESGPEFERIAATSPLVSESIRDNLLLTLRPYAGLQVRGGRQNVRPPPTDRPTLTSGPVHHVAAQQALGRFRVGAARFAAETELGRSTGTAVNSGVSFGQRLNVDGSWFQSESPQGDTHTAQTLTVRSDISPRLSVVQMTTRSQGRTTAALGGEIRTDYGSVRVDYNTMFVPTATGSQFRNALALFVNLQPFGNVQVRGGTYLRADGSVRHTLSASTFLYRMDGLSGGGFAGLGFGSPARTSIGRFIGLGRVVDDNGQPVAGAAVQVGRELYFTDSAGMFRVRMGRRGDLPLQVRTDEFMTPGYFVVLTAPSHLRITDEGEARPVTIVVTRMTTASAAGQ